MKISFNSGVSSSDNVSLNAKSNGDGTATLMAETYEGRCGNVSVLASSSVANSPVKICDANPERIGLILYNNGSNTIYCKYGSPGNGGTDMTFQIGSFTHWVMPKPIFTGQIYGVRNAGSGVVVATHMLP